MSNMRIKIINILLWHQLPLTNIYFICKNSRINMMFRSLVLNKILHKHTDDGNKNMKKIHKHKILKKNYEKQK